MHRHPRSSVVLGSLLLAASFGLADVASAQEVIERVVAVVNGEPIFLSELRAEAAPYLERAMALSPSARGPAIRDVYEDRLAVLIDRQLVHQQLDDTTRVTDAEVDALIAGEVRRSALAGTWPLLVEPDRAEIRRQLEYYRVLDARVRSRVNVSEADVRMAYDAMVARGEAPPPSFADAHDHIYRELLSSAMEVAQAQFIEELRRAATIEIRLD
jgi:hypothetical protein